MGRALMFLSAALLLFGGTALPQPQNSFCLACHATEGMSTTLPSGESLPLYVNPLTFEQSVHGKAGLNCVNCHRDVTEYPHPPLAVRDRRELTLRYYLNCRTCHEEQYKKTLESIHLRVLAAGYREAPVCTDCHTAHETLPKDHADSTVFARNLPRTCGRCHENSGLSERFGLSPRRYTTYLDSYHGISLLKYGNLVAANCSSCHGSHLILAASDPNSPSHPRNLLETCGRCHPNAGENFLKGKVHVEANPKVSPGVYAVRIFYTLFIGGLGLFFLLHISLDFIRWLRRHYA